MVWITGIAAFLIGAGTGALLYKLFRSDEAKVKTLETRLQALADEHENYKSSVHSHFNGTARLLSEMTDSYRNVYQHLAKGAQNLCPDYISSQLSLENFGSPQIPAEKPAPAAAAEVEPPPAPAAAAEVEPPPAPPLDYAARSDNGESPAAPNAPRKGALDEDYGIPRP